MYCQEDHTCSNGTCNLYNTFFVVEFAIKNVYHEEQAQGEETSDDYRSGGHP